MKKKRLIPVYLAVILSVVLAGQTVCFAGMSFDSAVSAEELIKEKLSIRRGIVEETVEYSEDEEPFYEEEESFDVEDGEYFMDEEDEINAVCYDEEDEDYSIEEEEEVIVEPIIEEEEEIIPEETEDENPLKGNEVCFCTTVHVDLGVPKDARFTFMLLNEDMEVLDEAQNDEDGLVEFEDQLIEEEGTYYFYIAGVNDLAGYEYDDHTEVIVVVVTEEYNEITFDGSKFEYFSYEFLEEYLENLEEDSDE